MRQNNYFLINLIFLIILLSFPSSAIAASKNEFPGIVWEQHFGKEQLVYNAHAIDTTSSGIILIAGTSNLAGSPDKPNSFWLWKVDQKGKKIMEKEIKSPYKDIMPSANYPRIKTLKALENNEILFIIEFIRGQPSIVKMDNKGEVLFIKDIAERKGETVISKMVPTIDKHFLLIGRRTNNPLIIKVDSNGNKLWEKNFNRNDVENFIDGLSTNDGGFILIGNLLTSPMLTLSSKVWVGKFDDKGEIQSETIFQGRNGSIAKGHDNQYIIVYDKMNFDNKNKDMWTQNIWLNSFNEDLKQLWKEKLLTVDRGMEGFKIASVSGGGFAIAGIKRGKVGSLWISRINEKGKEIWFFWEELNLKTMMFNMNVNDFISLNNNYFILSTVFSVIEGKKIKLNLKVGLIKLHLKQNKVE